MSVSNFLFLTKKIAPLIKTSCKNKYLKIVQNRKLQQPESPSTSSSSGLRKGPRLLTAEPSRTTQVRDMEGGGGEREWGLLGVLGWSSSIFFSLTIVPKLVFVNVFNKD